MNSYIIHPADVPIEYEPEEAPGDCTGWQTAGGGLLFRAQRALTEGAVLRLRIRLAQPPFEALCRVVDCRRTEACCFLVRVHLLREEDLYRLRAVEQACHIEHYKRQMWEKEGRLLTGNEAAYEWIDKYARQFPQPERRQR